MTKTQILIAVSLSLLAGVAFLSSSCDGPQYNFDIDTTSPAGMHRVKLQGRTRPTNPLPWESYVQTVKLEALTGTRVLRSDDGFFRADPLEGLFLQTFPMYEWVNDFTLRLGDSTSKDTFHDRLIAVNKLQEPLSLVILHYGKYERFLIFELAPSEQVEFDASPQFHANLPASTVFYGAYNERRSLIGNVSTAQRQSTSEGPIRVTVEISEK